MSNENTFIIKKAYVLSAIDKEGKRVYYDIDRHSGGWPYWTSWYGQEFDTLEKVPVIGVNHSLRNQVCAIEVLEVTQQARAISSAELLEYAEQKVSAEIAKIQQELGNKLAALAGYVK